MLEKIAMLDSQVIRALLIAIVGVLGLVLSFFGVDQALFSEKASKLVDALMLLIVAGGVFYASYARATKPTPPLTEAAVKKSQELLAKQSAWLPFVLAIGMTFLVAGCGVFGAEQPQGFKDRAEIAEQTVNGVITTAINSLNAGAIKSDDAAYVRTAAAETRAYLLAAETAYDAGDVSTAEGRLALASNVLRELQGYLRKPGGAP